MKRTLLAGIAVIALASPTFAQTVIESGPPSAGAVVTIAPEQRTRIREYVTEKRVKPVTIRERVSVGATIPADVDLVAVPSDWGPNLTRYRYVYSGDNVVLVEPSSRRVVQVID
jgi:hypothetical protein